MTPASSVIRIPSDTDHARRGHRLTQGRLGGILALTPDNVKDEPAGGSRGVDVFLKASQVDPSFAEVVDEFDEIAKGSAEPIKSPNDDRVFCARVVEHAEELRTVGVRAAGGVGKDPGAAGRGERVVLQ